MQDVADVLGEQPTPQEQRIIRYMLAADDFNLKELLLKGYDMIRPYAVPAIKTALQAAGVPAIYVNMLDQMQQLVK